MEKMTISELRKRMASDGSIDFIIEALMNANPIVEDIPWMSNCEEKTLSIRSVGDLANHLSKMGKEITSDGLFRWLREKGYLIKYGRDKNLPTELAMDMELFEVDKRSYIAKDGSYCLIRTTKVTGKGWIYFLNKLLAGKE